ncbi:MAG: DUF4878 domain-containing protein [Ignavibacteriae bacterium]|nr:DUF4878 domain-containing protein [Ignavibacteriota bacterium]
MKNIILINMLLLVLLWGCGSQTGSDSPGNAINNFVKAVKEKNSNLAWDNLSDESHKMYDKIAANTNRTGKQYFEVSMEDPNSLGVLADNYEVVEEKVDGDKATIIIKTYTGQSNELYAVKENGGWKFDYSRSIQESMKEKGTP